jgi:hypothetical protein
MDHKPDDKYWKQHLSLPLWQLIVLSLDIEPRSLIPGFNEGEFHGWPNAEKQKAYSERRSVALNHLRNGNLKLENPFQQRRYGYEYYMDVLISDFVSWSRSSTINWKIPKWLKDLELNVEQPEAPKKLNMKGENSSDKILAIVLTMDPIDYSQPYVAAKIIEAQGKTLGITLSEKTIAEKIKKATLHIKQIETTS